MCVGNICLFVLAKLYYVWRNRVIEKKMAGLPESEKARLADERFTH